MILAFFLGFLGVLLAGGGVVLGIFAWRNFRTASQFTRPLSHIGKLRPGHRKVRGKVAAFEEVLRSPMTNQECIYYRLRVYEVRKSWVSTGAIRGGVAAAGLLSGFGVGGALNTIYKITTDQYEDRAVHSWHHLLDEAVSVSFLIEDDTGLVEVEPRGATIHSKTKARMATNMLHPVLALSRLTDKLREEHGIHAIDERGEFKTLHFVEEVLLLGAKVTVVGPVEAFEGGELCFHTNGDSLLVSQGDVGKEGREARGRGIGFAMGATASGAVGLGCLLGAFALVVRALFVR